MNRPEGEGRSGLASSMLTAGPGSGKIVFLCQWPPGPEQMSSGVALDRLGTVAIIGVGLIGGSIGRALRARGLASHVIGIGRDFGRLAEAAHLAIIDEPTTDAAEGVARAEVVVVCTPPSRIAADCVFAANHGPEDMLVTDGGSTKARIVEAVEGDPRARSVFVGAHPIAGSEKKGARFASESLFDGRPCVLTPTSRTPRDRLDRARSFWKSLGCSVVAMSPDAHDDALALTSHLPHAVASALAGSIPVEHLDLAAGAYRDGTRVAGSDASLWTEIFLENRGPLLAALDAFNHRLALFRRALERNDAAALASWWTDAKDRRLLFDARNDDSPDAA